MEIIVFPRQFERNRALIEEGRKIFVTGDASLEENADGKILASSIVEFSQMPSELWIAFKDKETYISAEPELLKFLSENKGNDKVMIALAKERQRKALPVEYRVNADENLINELKIIYGQDFVKLVV